MPGMFELGSYRTATKIVAVVSFLSMVTVGVTGLSISSLGTLDSSADELEVAGRETTLGAGLNTLVVALNRAEYRVAADPAAETVAEVRRSVAEDRKLFDERLALARSTATPEQAKLLDRIEESYRSYLGELDDTLAVAGAESAGIGRDAARDRIIASVQSSRAAAAALRDTVRGYVSVTEQAAGTIAATATAIYERTRLILVAVAGLGILIGAAAAMAVARWGIVKPIAAIVACLKRLAEGDLSVEVTGTARRDEVGDIARTADVFKGNLHRVRDMEREADEERERNAAERRSAMLALADRFEQEVGAVVGGVSTAAAELQATATQLSAMAEEASRQSTSVSVATEQTSANVQTVAASAEELSISIGEIARQMSEASKLARDGADKAQTSENNVDHLTQAARRIGEIVSLISDIAAQTNLLALNATIEAARAGDAGKGFAVVASEVKTLATQTARATEEISQQIGEIQGRVDQAAEAITAVSHIIVQLDRNAASIASAAEEQNAATTEITRNDQQAAGGVQEVASNIEGVSQAATETGSASAQVLSSSKTLGQRAGDLRLAVDRFLGEVRAA